MYPKFANSTARNLAYLSVPSGRNTQTDTDLERGSWTRPDGVVPIAASGFRRRDGVSGVLLPAFAGAVH